MPVAGADTSQLPEGEPRREEGARPTVVEDVRGPTPSHVDIRDPQGVAFDEVAARLDLVAH